MLFHRRVSDDPQPYRADKTVAQLDQQQTPPFRVNAAPQAL